MNAPGLGTSVIATYERFAELLRWQGVGTGEACNPLARDFGHYMRSDVYGDKEGDPGEERFVKYVFKPYYENVVKHQQKPKAGVSPEEHAARRYEPEKKNFVAGYRRFCSMLSEALVLELGPKAAEAARGRDCGPEAAVHERAPAVIGCAGRASRKTQRGWRGQRGGAKGRRGRRDSHGWTQRVCVWQSE